MSYDVLLEESTGAVGAAMAVHGEVRGFGRRCGLRRRRLKRSDDAALSPQKSREREPDCQMRGRNSMSSNPSFTSKIRPTTSVEFRSQPLERQRKVKERQ